MYSRKGFDKLSPQQILNASVKHVLANGEPSVDERSCKYSGIGCGAAPFLTVKGRAAADNAVHGVSWTALVNTSQVSGHEQTLVQALQNAHDNAAGGDRRGEFFLNEWKANIKNVAERFNLHVKFD